MFQSLFLCSSDGSKNGSFLDSIERGCQRCAARCLCSRCLMILIIGTFQDKGSVILPHWSCLYPKRCQCWQYCDNARARNLCQAFSAALAVVQSALSEQSSTCLYKTGILSSEKLLAHQDFFFLKWDLQWNLESKNHQKNSWLYHFRCKIKANQGFNISSRNGLHTLYSYYFLLSE